MKIMASILAFLACIAANAPAFAQGFGGEGRNFTVRGFERIRVDGPVTVTLVTGVPPRARAVGDGDAINNVDVSVSGRTLVVRWRSAGRRGYRGASSGPVTVEVGTRELEQAWVNGAGRLDIDRIARRDFVLSVQGSGSASIAELDVDTLDVGVAGTAHVTLKGEVKDATMLVRGTSTLEAHALKVRDLELGVDGPGVARVHADDAIDIEAIGMADIQVSGRPACTINAQGPASILGC